MKGDTIIAIIAGEYGEDQCDHRGVGVIRESPTMSAMMIVADRRGGVQLNAPTTGAR